MSLTEELAGIAEAAGAFAGTGETVTAVIPSEPADGLRVYLCAFGGDRDRSWLALDALGEPIADRRLVRDAVSIAALCELAEETAGGGRLDELRARLEELRRTESPAGIEDAQAAAADLQETIEPAPRVASTAYLDCVGGATRRLEEALGELGASPFAEAMKQGAPMAEALYGEVEDRYKLQLD